MCIQEETQHHETYVPTSKTWVVSIRVPTWEVGGRGRKWGRHSMRPTASKSKMLVGLHEVYLIWQWRAFLAEVGKEKEGTFGSVRWPVSPEQSIHEQGVADKASQVGRGYIVDSFPCQSEELKMCCSTDPLSSGETLGVLKENNVIRVLFFNTKMNPVDLCKSLGRGTSRGIRKLMK